MRSSARPLLLRSLKVIGAAAVCSPMAVVPTCFGFRADDEILIESVLPCIISQAIALVDTHEQEHASLHLSSPITPLIPVSVVYETGFHPPPPAPRPRLGISTHRSPTS